MEAFWHPYRGSTIGGNWEPIAAALVGLAMGYLMSPLPRLRREAGRRGGGGAGEERFWEEGAKVGGDFRFQS
jgi:hypothetical protein